MRAWIRFLAVAALAAVVLAMAGAADGLRARTQRVKRALGRAAAHQAGLRGGKGDFPKDNSLCVLCHANFREEPLVAAHLKEGVTCAVCHGLSYEHMDDETSHTKPDLLFGRAQVARFCLRCHGPHVHPDRVAAFLAQWKGKTRPNGRLILQQATCTDCHGTHVIMAVPVVGEQSRAKP